MAIAISAESTLAMPESVPGLLSVAAFGFVTVIWPPTLWLPLTSWLSVMQGVVCGFATTGSEFCPEPEALAALALHEVL